MYTLKYSLDGNVNNLQFPPKRIVRGDFLRSQIKRKQQELDEMIFHFLMSNIVNCNYYSYMLNVQKEGQSKNVDDAAFSANKYLFDFMNAFYMHVEYLRNLGKYLPEIKDILDGHYHGKQGYRFLYGYRNAVVHQSAFLLDFSPNGQPFINLSELIQNNDKQKNSTGRVEYYEFGEVLGSLANASIKIGGDDYVSATEKIGSAFPEYLAMVNEIAVVLYEKIVEPDLLWLLQKLYRPAYSQHCYYTVYVDEEKGLGLDVNHVIDAFIRAFKKQLSPEYNLLHRLEDLLKENGYEMVYT